MSNETRFALNLTGLLFVVLAWLGSVVGALWYACQPNCGGAVVLALLAVCVGYGLLEEALVQVDRSLYRHPLPRR